MGIGWTKEAQYDLEAIERYVSDDDPEAAVRLVLKIVDTVDRVLAHNPASGRAGRVNKTREFVVPGTKYIVAYRVIHDNLQVLRVLHGAMKWPDRP